MSMNYFAFFPALVNEASNPNAKGTGFFANPAGPNGDQFAALGGQGISIVSYSQNQEEAMKFLEWFIKDETQKKWAELGGYTCNKAVLESAEFQNATPYNKAFYETMFKVKDFWATPEYAELLIADEPARLSLHHRRPGHGQGSARRAGRRLERDVQEIRPRQVSGLSARRGRDPPPPSAFRAGRNATWRQQS